MKYQTEKLKFPTSLDKYSGLPLRDHLSRTVEHCTCRCTCACIVLCPIMSYVVQIILIKLRKAYNEETL